MDSQHYSAAHAHLEAAYQELAKLGAHALTQRIALSELMLNLSAKEADARIRERKATTQPSYRGVTA